VQEGVRAYRARDKKPDAAELAQREGDAARNKGDLKTSAEAYGRALEKTKAVDPQRPERLALYALVRWRSCVLRKPPGRACNLV